MIEQKTETDSAATAPAFDRAELMLDIDGNTDLLHRLAKLYFECTPPLLQKIRDAVKNGDAPSLQVAAHTLKGSLAQFHAGAAMISARTLEELGRKNELADAPARVEELEKLQAQFETELREMIVTP